MKLFSILLTIISSLILFNKESFLIGVALLILVIVIIFKRYRKDKGFIIILITFFFIFSLLSFIHFKTFQNNGSFIGIVIKKSDSYVILFDGLEKIYVPIKEDSVGIFDILTIKGEITDYIGKKPIESEFDFTHYLFNYGVKRQIRFFTYTTNIKFIINVVEIKKGIISQFSNEESRELLECFLFGKEAYNEPLIQQLKSGGLLYLISLSGIHLTTLLNFLTTIINKKLEYKYAHLISFISIIPLLILQLGSLLVLRVFLSQIISVFLDFTGFKIDKLTKRSIPYLIMLLIDRYNLFSLSFIMPFLISFSLYFSKLLIYKGNRIYRKIFSKVILLLVIFPFNILFNNMFNVVTFTITSSILPLTKYLLLLLYPYLFMIKIPLLDEMFVLFIKCLNLINLKYLNINLRPFNQFEYVLYYVLIYSFFYFKEVNFKYFYRKINILFISFLFINIIPLKPFIFSTVNFINVGQGDATLITHKGVNILIDTGGNLYKDIATNSLIPYFRKNKIYKIDYVIITHYDMDHYYALDSLKNNFIVDNVYDYNSFKPIIYNNLSIYNINIDISNYVEENDKSIVSLINICDKKFLLMGDAPIEVENKIIKEYKNLDCDYLKVGHHGSNTSTSEAFINAVTPKEAIISCGVNNLYGHPHKDVIDVLKKNNIKIRRTDIEGTITYKIF